MLNRELKVAKLLGLVKNGNSSLGISAVRLCDGAVDVFAVRSRSVFAISRRKTALPAVRRRRQGVQVVTMDHGEVFTTEDGQVRVGTSPCPKIDIRQINRP